MQGLSNHHTFGFVSHVTHPIATYLVTCYCMINSDSPPHNKLMMCINILDYSNIMAISTRAETNAKFSARIV